MLLFGSSACLIVFTEAAMAVSKTNYSSVDPVLLSDMLFCFVFVNHSSLPSVELCLRQNMT